MEGAHSDEGNILGLLSGNELVSFIQRGEQIGGRGSVTQERGTLDSHGGSRLRHFFTPVQQPG